MCIHYWAKYLIFACIFIIALQLNKNMFYPITRLIDELSVEYSITKIFDSCSPNSVDVTFRARLPSQAGEPPWVA